MTDVSGGGKNTRSARTLHREHDLRRAEDRFREEHHDAHARIIHAAQDRQNAGGSAHATVDPEPITPPEPVTAAASGQPRIRIRVTRTPPALVMDGFDVRGFHAGHVYDADWRVAQYLVVAGYAVRVDGI